MRAWSVAVAWAAVFGTVAVATARIALRNLGEFRRMRTGPPLETDEIVAAAPPARKVPTGWPEPSAILNHRIAAAYRDYARDFADTRAIQSELLVVVGGAALGASIGGVLRGWHHAVPPYVALAVASAGVVVRQYVEPKWTRIAARYERRRAELSSSPAPVRPARRRKWFWPGSLQP